ncbi:type II secretion system protein H (GspH) [Nitrospirillum amazonense]|uniref:Type II secretion system protein H (GspH) n=1 Tax=Nitrospirillum amazonense TaxID=28077 RepID=A0A560EJW1_9PROT|nr:prepilin-type N-terminal cleavage/methylation domain-containing protein [Nitrospirillum amazonense]TWB09662.1 type II secretion system protein H (GspH) [Nitrospirillum amazonense]
MRNAGFTLVELLVVLAIMGLAGSVLSLGLQQRLPGLRLDAAVSAIEEELRSRQSNALVSRRDVTFSLKDLEGNTAAVRAARLRRIAAVEVRIAGADPGFPDAIRFLAGGWSKGGRLTLRDGGREKVVLVDWPLGSVHVELHDTK